MKGAGRYVIISAILGFGATILYNIQYFLASQEIKTNAPEFIEDYNPFGALLAKLNSLLLLCYQNAVWVLFFIVLLCIIVYTLIYIFKKEVIKDENRLFSFDQRQLIKQNAKEKCENRFLFFFRCLRHGTDADHIFPHSLGGNTDIENAQWLCKRCNCKKGAKKPSKYYMSRLKFWRKFYYAT
jgi:hypothetical protein